MWMIHSSLHGMVGLSRETNETKQISGELHCFLFTWLLFFLVISYWLEWCLFFKSWLAYNFTFMKMWLYLFFLFWKLIKKPYYFYLWIDPFHVLWESEVIIDWFELFNYLVHHFDHYFLIFFKRVIIFVNTFQVQITWGRLENSLVQSDQNNNGEDMCQTDFVE